MCLLLTNTVVSQKLLSILYMLLKFYIYKLCKFYVTSIQKLIWYLTISKSLAYLSSKHPPKVKEDYSPRFTDEELKNKETKGMIFKAILGIISIKS